MFSQQFKKSSLRLSQSNYNKRYKSLFNITQQQQQLFQSQQYQQQQQLRFFTTTTTTTTTSKRTYVSNIFNSKPTNFITQQQHNYHQPQQLITPTPPTPISSLPQLRLLAPAKYTLPMVIYAMGMREGIWSVSPHKVPEVHVNLHWEQSNENRYNNMKKPLDDNREQFDTWIGSVMRSKGLSGDPSTFTDEQFEIDDQIQRKFDDVLDRIERYQAKPELFVWCRDYLKDIFRFSNDDGMNQTFRVQLGVDQFKNMIRYKTFIEKERYKMMRDRECLMEIQLQFTNNLDALQEYINQIHPVNKRTKIRTMHPQLEPIYESLSVSLANIVEVNDMLTVFGPFFNEYDQLITKALNENNTQEAFELIQQQAAFSSGVSKISRGLLEYLDTTLYQFEEYYNPARVRNIIEYIRIESDPKRRYKLDALTLEKPPIVEIDADAFYRAITDATEGVVGTYQPTSAPYYPIEHIPLSEKLLQPTNIPQNNPKLTPDERNSRFKLGLDEINSLKRRRHSEFVQFNEERLNKALLGYSNDELNELGDKFHT